MVYHTGNRLDNNFLMGEDAQWESLSIYCFYSDESIQELPLSHAMILGGGSSRVLIAIAM